MIHTRFSSAWAAEVFVTMGLTVAVQSINTCLVVTCVYTYIKIYNPSLIQCQCLHPLKRRIPIEEELK